MFSRIIVEIYTLTGEGKMKLKLSVKKQSVILTWLLSYLIFMTLFLSISVLIYFRAKETIKNEINNSNSFILKSTQANMDNVLENIKKTSMELSTNSNVQHILLLKGDLQNSDYFDVYKIATALNSYKNANNSISSIYILLKDYDIVITSDGIFSLKDFYRNNYSLNDTDFVDWLNEFNAVMPEKYFMLYVDKNHVNDNKLNYVRGLLQIPYTNLSISSGIVINEKSLTEQLSNINKITTGISFIIDSKNNIIAASSPINLSSSPKFNDLSGESGVLYKHINSKNVVISYISSKQADWKYVTIIPNDIFFQRLNYIKYFTILGLTLSILVGGILICYFLKKNYNPVTKLLQLLKDKTKGDENGSNEYILIEKAIEQTLNDNYVISNKLLNQKAVLKGNFLEKLIKGGINESTPIEEGLSSFEITFESDYFAVISLFIDDSDENIKVLNDYFSSKFNALNFILSNILVDLIEKNNKAFMIEVDSSVTCLINFYQDRIFFAKSDMISVMSEAQEFINKHFKINISFSVSSIHENVENIHIAYKESLYALNYKNIMGIKKNICYDDVNNNVFKDTYYYPLSQEQQLLSYIKSGNYTAAKEIIDGVFSKNLQAGMTIELAQCLMLNMVSTMIRAVNDISNIENDTFLQELNPINQLLHCKTLIQMKNQLDMFLEIFCSHVNQTIEKSSSWVISDVIPYLKNNFNDPNLGLEQIGEQFNVHPVYISKIFKDHVGEGLLDFITNLRIEHSKMLLKENKNATIEKIAELVGYPNVRTFTRLFKKYTNLSPGKYRDENSL